MSFELNEPCVHLWQKSSKEELGSTALTLESPHFHLLRSPSIYHDFDSKPVWIELWLDISEFESLAKFEREVYHKTDPPKVTKHTRRSLHTQRDLYTRKSNGFSKPFVDLATEIIPTIRIRPRSVAEPQNIQPTSSALPPRIGPDLSSDSNGSPAEINQTREVAIVAELDTAQPLVEPMEYEEDPEIGRNFGIHVELATRKCSCQSFIFVVAIAFAPITMLLGMTAKEGDGWKSAFIASSGCWLLVSTLGIYLDLRNLDKPTLVRRCLWHLGFCVVMMYFFVAILKIGSESLPQWLPTIIDVGLGASMGVQNIPSDTRDRLREYVTNLLGSICGGTQVVVQGREQLLSHGGQP